MTGHSRVLEASRVPKRLPVGSLVLSSRMWAAGWMAWWPSGHSLAFPLTRESQSPRETHCSQVVGFGGHCTAHKGAVSNPQGTTTGPQLLWVDLSRGDRLQLRSHQT